MEIIRKIRRPGVHVLVPELEDLYVRQKISRLQFLRYATLLGVSLAGATTFLAGCSTGEPPATAAPPTAAPAATATPVPTKAPSGPKRGGTLTLGDAVFGIDHPARFAGNHGDANNAKFVLEYLTETTSDFVTVPMLLESWSASDDLLTWTLNLRKDVVFSTGEPFTADDVVFTMKEWLNPDVGSSFLGMMNYLQPTGIEKRDDYTVALHLDSPRIEVAENLYHYPGGMLDHRTFTGNWLDNPVGTGPFTLEEWSADERVVLKARQDGKYWKKGADGKPLPYLDQIVVIQMMDLEAQVNAIKGGQIDVFQPTDYRASEMVKDDPNVIVDSIVAGNTALVRMRADKDPWTDVRVRNALKKCQDREKILKLAAGGQGVTACDSHICPVHPEYTPCEPPLYDPEGAKALLAEAGYPDGIDVTLTALAEFANCMGVAEALKEDAEAAGIRITIDALPSPAFWDGWTEFDFATNIWGPRELATMVLNLGYSCDAEGTPVPWNESHWCDQEFNELLAKASATLDLDARKEICKDLMRIQIERGTVGIAFWQNAWSVFRPYVKGIHAHQNLYTDHWKEAWLDTEA